MRLPLSMLRLSTPEETRTTLLLAGHDRLIRALETYLSLRGAREEKCLLLVGISGSENLVRQTRRQALGALAMRGGVAAGKAFGREWHKNRFRAPYLRNALWEAGWAVDTLETAAPWSRVPALLASVETALRTGLAGEAERVHAFTHLSHVYLDGSSLYTTYLFRLGADPDVNLARWRTLKTAASDAIVAGGGTISHQHGVGTDHAPWLAAEKGELGIRALREALPHVRPRRSPEPREARAMTRADGLGPPSPVVRPPGRGRRHHRGRHRSRGGARGPVGPPRRAGGLRLRDVEPLVQARARRACATSRKET